MKEQFIKDVFESIVEEGTKTYREIYENYDITEKTIAYWKNAKQLYQSLDETQRIIFMGIIRQTIIDTISTLFGVFDGTTFIFENEYAIEVKVNEDDTDNELQDCFLEYVEEKENDDYRL